MITFLVSARKALLEPLCRGRRSGECECVEGPRNSTTTDEGGDGWEEGGEAAEEEGGEAAEEKGGEAAEKKAASG